MPGILKDEFLSQSLELSEPPLIVLMVEDPDEVEEALATGLQLSQSFFLAGCIQGEGCRVIRAQGWSAFAEAVEQFAPDCVFFPNGLLKADNSGQRREWALKQKSIGMSLVAYDWEARHHANGLSEENEAFGFRAETCLFFLQGAAQALCQNALIGRARREREVLSKSAGPAVLRPSRAI